LEESKRKHSTKKAVEEIPDFRQQRAQKVMTRAKREKLITSITIKMMSEERLK
jgi:hypothetical protein